MAPSAHWLMSRSDDGTALIDADAAITVSYAELSVMIDRRATELSSLTGGIALLGISNSVPSIVDYLALTATGVTVMLVDPNSSRSSIDSWLEAYHPDAVLGLAGAIDRVDRASGVERRETVLLPTSGSTGSPKFVRLTRSNLSANADQIVDALRIDESHRALAHLPLFYSYGLSVLNSHLARGASVVLTGSSAIRPEFWKTLADHRVTSLPGVPYSYEMFRRMDIGRRDLPHLRDLTQAGGRLDRDRIIEFHEMCRATERRLWVMYGQTEATARISVLPCDHLPDRIGSVGLPVRDTSVWIDQPDDDGIGELIVSGPQVMSGYAVRREDIDGSDVCGGVLRTGDLARIDDGWITITGRVARIAKIYGARVSLDDVEERLAGFGRVAAVDGGDSVTVFVESVGGDVDAAGTARRMERHLALPVRSLTVVIVESLPVTASGKIDYGKLRESCR